MNESREAELPGQPVPIGDRDDAFILEGGESGENVGSAAIDTPVAQLPDHTGKAMLVLIGIQSAVFPLTT
jgi:hypothetical protein